MNARREHLPSPVTQRILWSSPLKGMEQPVPSFKSFIRTVPPNPDSEDEKPLPPTPSTPNDTTSTPSFWPPVTPFSKRTSSVASWRAPAEWEWVIPSPPIQPYRSSSIFSARKYSPLLPEPIQEDFEMKIDSSSFQQTELTPIQESSDGRPDPPPRNPCRSTPLQTPSATGVPGISKATMHCGLSSPPHTLETYASYPEALRLRITSPQSSDFTYPVSDASTKAKAFESLGIGSPCTEDNAPANLKLRGKKLQPLSRGNLLLDHGLENRDLADELRQMSFSQDYHSVLADQYHDLHAQHQALQAPPSLPSSSPSLQTHATSGPGSEQKRKHKRMTSWVPLHHLKNGSKRHNAHSEAHQRPASDPVIIRRNQIPDSEVDQLLGKNIRLPNLLAHTRGLRSKKRRAKTAQARDPNGSSSTPRSSLLPHIEQRTPLLRLPGGFALVRHSPSDAPKSQTASSHDVSPMAEIPHQWSNTNSLVSNNSEPSQRRSSLYSQDWQVLVAPTVAVNNRQRNSTGSRPSLHSRASSSSPPTSPLAQEISLPRTPPPLPKQSARSANAPAISLPLPYQPEKRHQKKLTRGGEDHDTHMHRILDKARGARDTWRRHQRELKHEKLKQSIKILGPTDPAVVAGYVKREGRRLGDGEVESGRMPGYLVSGPM